MGVLDLCRLPGILEGCATEWITLRRGGSTAQLLPTSPRS